MGQTGTDRDQIMGEWGEMKKRKRGGLWGGMWAGPSKGRDSALSRTLLDLDTFYLLSQIYREN
jgi:hypothetical protein